MPTADENPAPDTTTDVARNLADVGRKINAALAVAGREKGGARLVCVSKTHPPETVRLALDAGQRVFGENRVQEAEAKWPALRETYPDVELHLIGPLQTNKVKAAIATFDVIETVDREKLARALARDMEGAGKQLAVFIQVNTGEEEQKAGVAPADTQAFVRLCRDELGLDVRGLMCIPPVSEEASLHFALLAKLAEGCGLHQLSMGMSGDFETAVQFGATHVRVGSAIFGERH